MIHEYRNFNEQFKTLTDEQKNELKARYRDYIELRNLNDNTSINKFGVYAGFVSGQIKNSNFIYLPDKYKMVSKDDRNEFLDFSYNYNDRKCEWLAVTPDYDRQTHVISLLNGFDITNK